MIYDYPYHRNYYNKYNIYQKHNYLKEYNLEKSDYNKINSEKINNDNFNTKNNLIAKEEKTIIDENNDRYKSDDDTIINIFGIKLAFDDLLILGLLYLLYMEDVKDISLYIVLILLLLN